MLVQELNSCEESRRVERYLMIKDRILSSNLARSDLKVELPSNQVSKRRKAVIYVSLFLLNYVLCIVPWTTTWIFVTFIGSFSCPMVVFVLPPYLFYDLAKKSMVSSGID